MTELYWGPMPGDEGIMKEDLRDPYHPIYRDIPGSFRPIVELKVKPQPRFDRSSLSPEQLVQLEAWERDFLGVNRPHHPCG